MQEDGLLLEDGEVLDDSDNDYTPLQRPTNYSTMESEPQTKFPVQKITEEDEELHSTSNSSDSDSDTQSYRTKRPKLKAIPPLEPVKGPKNKKYNIWSTRVQEDVLAETLNTCDVTQKDRTRDVESYDYPTHENSRNRGCKRNMSNRYDNKLRLPKKIENEDANERGTMRVIADLNVITEENDSAEKVAKDIANKLCEDEEGLILNVVNAVGILKATSTFKEVQDIERNGGMLIFDKSRRRTPGGIYLYLIKKDTDLTREQFDLIFEESRQKNKALISENKKKKSQQIKAKRDSKLKKMNLSKDLPELVSKGELAVNHLQEVTSSSKWSLKTEVDDVVNNPPPTPEPEPDQPETEEMENVGTHTMDTL